MSKNFSLENTYTKLTYKFIHCRIIYNSKKTDNSLNAQQNIM